MSKRERIEARNLAELENQFARLLPQCLRECAAGRLGLFANSPIVAVYADWPEAVHLRSLAKQIKEIRAAQGSAHPVCDLFLKYCQHGENIREDPSLAVKFLNELGQQPGSE
jgi:hypothetical protein